MLKKRIITATASRSRRNQRADSKRQNHQQKKNKKTKTKNKKKKQFFLKKKIKKQKFFLKDFVISNKCIFFSFSTFAVEYEIKCIESVVTALLSGSDPGKTVPF